MIIALYFPVAISVIDNNIATRALFAVDSLRGLVQSTFLGVGYGTESVLGSYNVGGQLWTIATGTGGLSEVPIHNSILSILFKTGLVGFLAFSKLAQGLYIKATLDQHNLFSAHSPVRPFVLFFLLVNITLNPGLEGIDYIIPNCLGIAFLLL